MAPTTGLQHWTNLIGDSIELTKVADLGSTSGNYHTYNKKVIYAAIKKNVQGGYKWKLQCFPLQKDKVYPVFGNPHHRLSIIE